MASSEVGAKITHRELQDGTYKVLFGLYDDQAIETVIMRHNYGEIALRDYAAD